MKVLILLLFSMLCVTSSMAVINPKTTETWTVPFGGCTGTLSCTYNIYRGDTAGTETLLKSGITDLQYVDTTVVRGNKYCYYATASNLYGEGDKTGERCLAIPTTPKAPGNFKVTSN